MIYLLPALIFLISIAFFSGLEIAYISANRLKIEMDKKQELFIARVITFIINRPGKFIATLLTGRIISLAGYATFVSLWLGTSVPDFKISSAVFVILQISIAATILLLIGELLPRVFFRAIPNLALNILSLPGFLFYIILYPVTSIILWLTRHYQTNRNNGSAKYIFNRIEMTDLINQTANNESEVKETDNDLKLFQNALEFSSVKVRDCMVPRTEIIASEINTPIAELHHKFISTGFSKILIYQENIDNIVGYITSKTIFKKIKSIKEWIIEALFVPETMSAHRLLKKFIQEKKNLAVVVDEFGGVSGMVAIEDIIEEIFGEIEDEYDTDELTEKQISEHEFIFSGRLEIEYLNEKYHLNIPESEDYDTLAGFIFQYHENIPLLNEHIYIEPFTFKILKVSKTKIDLIHLKAVSG